MKTNERLLKYTEKPNGEEGCWIWAGPPNFGIAGHTYTPRRAYWEMKNPVLNKKYQVRGGCGTKNCVNPNGPHTILLVKGQKYVRSFNSVRQRSERGVFVHWKPAGRLSDGARRLARRFRSSKPERAAMLLEIAHLLRPARKTREPWERDLIELSKRLEEKRTQKPTPSA